MQKQLTAQQYLLFPGCTTTKLSVFIRVCTLLSFYHEDRLEIKKSDIKDNINAMFKTYNIKTIVEDSDITEVFAQLKKAGYLEPRKKGSKYWSLVQRVLPFA